MSTSSKKILTRQCTGHYLFGYPRKFNQQQLPTVQEVYLHYLAVSNELKIKGQPIPGQSMIANQVATDIEHIWFRASIPTISHKAVREKIIRCVVSKAQAQSKVAAQRRKKNCSLPDVFTKLFDIATCKCDLSATGKCSFPKSHKIPPMEIPFLIDQRDKRKMMIGGIDTKTTSKIKSKQQKIMLQESKQELNKAQLSALSSTQQCSSDESDNNDGNEHTSDEPDSDCIIDDCNSPTTSQMRYPLPLLSAECDRYQISNRAGAAIVNAALKDLGVITPHDQHLIIDHSKLRRERLKYRQARCQSHYDNQSEEEITAIYFDGRIDWTMIKSVNADGSSRSRKCREEHYVLVSEPGGRYISHVTPDSSKAKDISQEIIDVYRSHNGNLKVLGCDGTVNNTGPNGGIIHRIETNLQCSVHWFICQLHGNELPLRHLFQYLDGNCKGPSSFSGPLGKAISGNIQDLPLVNFNPIKGLITVLPSDVVAGLSSDQRYLYDIASAVQVGKVSPNVATKQPGTLHNARWLTLANRLLRLYVSTDSPTKPFTRIVSFILNHYAPSWFQIKHHSLATDGPNNLLFQVKLTAKLPNEDRVFVQPIIQRNAFFAHPENMLLSMLIADNENLRSQAVDIIIKCRNSVSNNNGNALRTFIIPEINFQAIDLMSLINWENITVTEPPLTRDMSLESLYQCKNTPINLPHYPCHTEAVERMVQLVTTSCKNCYGEENRHGWILNVLHSRLMRPSFESKKDDYLHI